MTREEAIKKINAIKKYLTAGNPIWDVIEIDEALNMAIEALQFAKHFDLLKEFQSLQEVVRCKECKHHRLCNEDTHLIACGYEWCAWWQRPVISTGYCHCGTKMDGEKK